MQHVTMRRLSRETNKVIEQAVRGGEPIIVTVYGRPAVAVVPLVGRMAELPHELFGPATAPEHVLEALREAQADIIAGRLLPNDEAEREPTKVGMHGLAPQVAEHEDRFVYTFELPGFAPDGVRVKVDENIIELEAVREPASGQPEVHETVFLPAPVSAKDASLDMADGLLHVTLPRVRGKARSVQLTPKAHS